MARVLIAGCGYVGCALGAKLAADGHDVWGLRRDPGKLPPEIQPLSGDLTRLDTLGCLPMSLDFVFYTAGAGRGDEDAYRAIYLDGMGRLLDALSDQGERPKRIFFTSSTAVYAQRRGEWVDEDSVTAPANFRGDILLCAERLLLASPQLATIVRLGGIYGPDRASLLRAAIEGKMTIQAGPPHYTNRIHRDDAAGALRHLMGCEDLPEIVLGVDREPADEAEVYRWLAERTGAPTPLEGDGSAGPRPRRSGSKRCSNARLLATGYRFHYPTFREGYESVL
jgi:nucleoside-diphosphate-sugar epimerase